MCKSKSCRSTHSVGHLPCELSTFWTQSSNQDMLCNSLIYIFNPMHYAIGVSVTGLYINIWFLQFKKWVHLTWILKTNNLLVISRSGSKKSILMNSSMVTINMAGTYGQISDYKVVQTILKKVNSWKLYSKNKCESSIIQLRYPSTWEETLIYILYCCIFYDVLYTSWPKNTLVFTSHIFCQLALGRHSSLLLIPFVLFCLIFWIETNFIRC